MFTSNHVIWKIAFWSDKGDDWLTHAEYLIDKWSIQDTNAVEFESTWDIIIASWLLEDDLLPAPAKAALPDLC